MSRRPYSRLSDAQKAEITRLLREDRLTGQQIADRVGCNLGQVYTYRHKLKNPDHKPRLTDIGCLVLHERVTFIPEDTIENPDDVNGPSFPCEDTAFDCSRCGYPMMASWFTFRTRYDAVANFNYCPNCDGTVNKPEKES